MGSESRAHGGHKQEGRRKYAEYDDNGDDGGAGNDGDMRARYRADGVDEEEELRRKRMMIDGKDLENGKTENSK
jgi:hypothetical protein